MKRSVLAILLAVLMTMSLITVGAVAYGENWVEVSTADELEAALSNGGNIKLADNISVDTEKDWTVTGAVVLDLNGKCLTSTFNKSSYFLMTVNGGSLTVMDSTVDKTGKIEIYGKNSRAIKMDGAGSVFTLESGTLYADYEVLEVMYNAVNSVVNINGGTMTAKSGNKTLAAYGVGTVVNMTGGELIMEAGSGQCFYLSGNTPDSWVTFNMSGGKMTSSAAGVYVSNYAAMNISDDAYIESNGSQYGAIYICTYDKEYPSIINISGGTVKSTGNYAIYSSPYSNNYSDIVISGGDVLSESSSVPGVSVGSSVTALITGGTVSGNVDKYVSQSSSVSKDSSGNTVVVPNGTDGSVAVVNGRFYRDLQSAIDEARSGETVQLLEDIDANINIGADQNITLDLNGCTLDGGTVASKAALTNYGKVVITDSSEGQNGMIKRSDVGSPAYYTILNEGVMSIQNGNIWNDSGYSDQWSGSSLICNGLKYPATLTISGGYISQGNFIAVKNDENGILNITGGTITSNTQAVQNWCEAEISGGELTGAVTTWAYGSYDGETVISGGKIDGDVTSSWFSGGGNVVQDGVAPKVTITGGEIKGELYKENATTTSNTERVPDETEGGSIAVNGGEFENPVQELFLSDALLYQAKSADGIYTYHETREEALEAAGPNGKVTAVTGSDRVTYTVTIVYNNGTLEDKWVVIDGETITLPDVNNSGYIFLGWRNGNVTYKAGDAVTVTSDMTFTAVWGNLPDVDPEEPEEPEVPDFPFYDVNIRDWYYDAVKYVYNKGLMDGIDTNEFAPNATLTRAMVWTIIARAEGVDTTGGSSWYAKAQEWVVAKGISDGENPSAAITRQELVTMLYRLAGEPTVSGSVTAPDAASVSAWAGDAMVWAMNIGLIEGDENGAVTPTATATRAQAAAIFMRYIEA